MSTNGDGWDDAVGKEALMETREYRPGSDNAVWFAPVRVIAVKRLFGKIFLHVIPCGGRGDITVRPTRLEFTNWVAPVKERADG